MPRFARPQAAPMEMSVLRSSVPRKMSAQMKSILIKGETNSSSLLYYSLLNLSKSKIGAARLLHRFQVFLTNVNVMISPDPEYCKRP